MTADKLRNLFLSLAPDGVVVVEELVEAMTHESFEPFAAQLDSFRRDGGQTDEDLEHMVRSLGWGDIKLELAIYEDLGEWKLGEEE
jgi:hypothetical protein